MLVAVQDCFSVKLPQMQVMVVGVDISRKLLLKAKEQARAFPNVFVLQADADHLPFKDGFFDDVFAFTVLQNMPNPNETLSELKAGYQTRRKSCGDWTKESFSTGEVHGCFGEQRFEDNCFC